MRVSFLLLTFHHQAVPMTFLLIVIWVFRVCVCVCVCAMPEMIHSANKLYITMMQLLSTRLRVYSACLDCM